MTEAKLRAKGEKLKPQDRKIYIDVYDRTKYLPFKKEGGVLTTTFASVRVSGLFLRVLDVLAPLPCSLEELPPHRSF